MSPLEKVFFLKNMCHTGTSNGGKKWRMVLFQVDSLIHATKNYRTLRAEFRPKVAREGTIILIEA